jgi:hypothetical protein
VLGGLLILMAVLSTVAAVPLLHGRPVAGYVILALVAYMLALVAYMLALVAYLFFSPTMQAVFRKADARKWSGG